MRKLPIALGSSRYAATWHGMQMDIDEIWRRLQDPIRTSETAEQYQAMSKDERDDTKDRGGYVAGKLKGTRRKKTDVLSRSIIVLDSDALPITFFDDLEILCPYFALLYTTHSHRPEAPRARLMFPLARDVTPEEFNAIVRYLAAELGMELIDPCSFEIHHLMLWPTVSADGEYICRRYEGEWLDPDVFLAEHPNWRDSATLPTSPKEKMAKVREHRMQEDPLTKKGPVGAFCRAYYPIQTVIPKYLSKIYAPTTVDDRFDYIPGEGSCGVVVYEDRCVYSHHSTDPACGKRLNAFDLVRIHLFGDDADSYGKMCALVESDELAKKELEKEQLAEAQEEFKAITTSWEEPIPFGRYKLEPFPADALPPDIRAYAEASAESTQTPVDMAGSATLAVMAMCCQGKYVIQGKPDWIESLNLYVNIIAEPSERKSSVQKGAVRPANDFETQYNQRNSGLVESSKMMKRGLEARRKAIEDKMAKGKCEQSEVDQLGQEIADFKEVKPLRLYVDDVTTEKLVSVMATNHGRAALISSEGGIFDTLSGTYSRNVNIDALLKAYSGDTIRVDRIGRESESVMNPTLTILLMTQPKTVATVLSNSTFRGRGLTARFLYSLPDSSVGDREFESESIPEEVYRRYEQKIVNMLEDEHLPKPEIITLSPAAFKRLSAFAREIEPKLKTDYAEISDWAGKLVGNTLRIAGILCRASVFHTPEFLTDNEPLVVSDETMANAIRLGRYYLNHALAVFDVIPEANTHKRAEVILEMIKTRKLTEFDRREAMRNCRVFKTVSEIQPVLDFLEDYGYIFRRPDAVITRGRPPLPKYVVNPRLLS